MTAKCAGGRAGSHLVIEKSISAQGATPLKGRRDRYQYSFCSYDKLGTEFPNRLSFHWTALLSLLNETVVVHMHLSWARMSCRCVFKIWRKTLRWEETSELDTSLSTVKRLHAAGREGVEQEGNRRSKIHTFNKLDWNLQLHPRTSRMLSGECFYSQTRPKCSYLATMASGMFGGENARLSNLRTLQLSSSMMLPADGVMKEEDYLWNLQRHHKSTAGRLGLGHNWVFQTHITTQPCWKCVVLV